MIVIKDTGMPKSCEDCQMSSCKGLSGHFYCDITMYDIDIENKERDADCPLVEIITCKDCKYYRVEDDDEYCTNHTIKDNKFWVREDYFCADGERRE